MATGLEIERKFKVDRKKFFDELKVNSELLHAFPLQKQKQIFAELKLKKKL